MDPEAARERLAREVIDPDNAASGRANTLPIARDWDADVRKPARINDAASVAVKSLRERVRARGFA